MAISYGNWRSTSGWNGVYFQKNEESPDGKATSPARKNMGKQHVLRLLEYPAHEFRHDCRPSKTACQPYLDLRLGEFTRVALHFLVSVQLDNLHISRWFKQTMMWLPADTYLGPSGLAHPDRQEVVDIVGSLCAAWQASIKKQKRAPWLSPPRHVLNWDTNHSLVYDGLWMSMVSPNFVHQCGRFFLMLSYVIHSPNMDND